MAERVSSLMTIEEVIALPDEIRSKVIRLGA